MKRTALLTGVLAVIWATSATAGIDPVFPFPSPFLLI